MTVRHGESFVAVHCKTAPLCLKDTHDYVQHRLRIAGARTDALFMPDAVNAVHVHTNGIPRLINLLCAQALAVAAGYQAERVFPYMVDEAAAKICSGSQIPPSSPDSPGTPAGTASPTLLLNPPATALLSRSLTTLYAVPSACEPAPPEAALPPSAPPTSEQAPAVDPGPADGISSDARAMVANRMDASDMDASAMDASSKHPHSTQPNSMRLVGAHPHEAGPGTFASSGASRAQEKARNAASRQICKGRKTSAGGRTARREMRLYSECGSERGRILQTGLSPVTISSRKAPWVAASSGWSSRFPASFGSLDSRDRGVGAGWEPVAESLVLGAFHQQELRDAAFSTGTGGNAVFGAGGDARGGISPQACCACRVWVSWDAVHRYLSGTGNLPPTDRTQASAAALG